MSQTPQKSRPVIFKAEMVRAILEGRKKQTRRVINERIHVRIDDYIDMTNYGAAKKFTDTAPRFCPYGVAGDRLWVREKHRAWSWRDDNRITLQFADMATFEDTSTGDEPNYESWYERVAIESTDECAKAGCKQDGDGNYTWGDDANCPTHWRPSIHMPRWASRITLEITKVRVERLQEISEEDCVAEGIAGIYEKGTFGNTFYRPDRALAGTARDCYAHLWERINGKGAWEQNPWVWCITFEKV